MYSTGLNSTERSKFSTTCYVLFSIIFIGGNYMLSMELILKQFGGLFGLVLYFFHDLDVFYIQQ